MRDHIVALQTEHKCVLESCQELEREGFAVTYLSVEPDVLVLDMRLPDTDGIALLQRIRETRPTLPVVVTTAYVSMEPLMNVLDLGHSRYLVKPYELSELAAAIDAAG